MFYKNYFKYIIPSMISFTLSGLYSIVDGLFIGQSVGDLGLAAINIAWPVASVTYAVGTGLGMGGSVVSSIFRGKEKPDDVRHSVANCLTMLIIACVLITAALFFFAPVLMRLFGAEGITYEYSLTYLRTLAIGATCQIFGCGILPILRSSGKPVMAMAAIVTSCVINIVLDWLFVMKLGMGVSGAAWATIIGEGFAMLMLPVYFIDRNNRFPVSYMKLKGGLVKHILKIGISPFGLTILPSVSILLINFQAIRLGGDCAVAAYSAIAYLLSVIQLLVQGVSEGSQPILSYNTGAGNRINVRKAARLTFSINIGIGVLGAIILICFSGKIGYMFNLGSETMTIMLQALPLLAAAMPLYGFSRTTADYLYAINRPFPSTVMIYSEGLLLMPALLIILPKLFNLWGVWISTPAAQVVLLILGMILIIFTRKRSPESNTDNPENPAKSTDSTKQS